MMLPATPRGARIRRGLALAALAAWRGRAQNDVSQTPGDVKILEDHPGCFHHGFRWTPDIQGADVTVASLSDCRFRCLNNVTGCAVFAYWAPTGKCYFGDNSSSLVPDETGAIAGRAVCKEAHLAEACRPGELPEDGFPGFSTADSNAAWPSGRQPWGLECWPANWTGGYMPCATVEVLADTDKYWSGKCSGLSLQSNVTDCEKDCMQNPLCPSYQVTESGECWQGVGRDCFVRQDFVPKDAKRFQHGHVRVLMDLTGWQIIGLTKTFDNFLGYFTRDADAIEMCRDVCYSDIRCQYWSYAPNYGCWVEDASQDYGPMYPLTLDFAQRYTPFALDTVAGELIQHYCPPSQTTAWPQHMPVMASCMKMGVRYKPDMMLRGASVEMSAPNCQARCARTDGCKTFAFWPDGSCYLQGRNGKPVTAEDHKVISGPSSCAEAESVAFDDQAKQALNPSKAARDRDATPAVVTTVAPAPILPEAPPAALPAAAPPRFYAEVRVRVEGLDLAKVSDGHRSALEQQLVQVFASNLRTPASAVSEDPGGVPGTVWLRSWQPTTMLVTAYVPNQPPQSSDTGRVRDLMRTGTVNTQILEAVANSLATDSPALSGTLRVVGIRADPVEAAVAVNGHNGCDWFCSWWPVIAAVAVVVLVGVIVRCHLAKPDKAGSLSFEEDDASAKMLETDESDDDDRGGDRDLDARVWAEEPPWSGPSPKSRSSGP